MKNKNMLFPIIVTIISILFGYVSDRYNISFLLYLAVLFPFAFSFFLSYEQNFGMFCLLLASNRLLTVSSVSTPLLLMLGMLLKLKKQLKIPLAFLFITTILITIPLFYPSKIIFSILLVVKIVIMLIYFYNVFSLIDIKDLKLKYTDYMFWGIIITFILSIIFNSSIIIEKSRFALTDAGGENILGILCGIVALIVACNSIDKVKTKYPIIKIISLLSIGLMTGSRSFLLIVIIGATFILIHEILHGNIKKIIKIIFIFIMLIGLFYIIIKAIPFLNNFYDRFIYRIQKLNNNDVSNGRYELWESYINVFKNNIIILLFGYPNYKDFGIDFVAHNFLIEQIASNGIIGSLLIMILFVKTIKKIIKSRKICINIYTSILISFLAVSMFSHSMFGIFQTTILIISILLSTKKEVV